MWTVVTGHILTGQHHHALHQQQRKQQQLREKQQWRKQQQQRKKHQPHQPDLSHQQRRLQKRRHLLTPEVHLTQLKIFFIRLHTIYCKGSHELPSKVLGMYVLLSDDSEDG